MPGQSDSIVVCDSEEQWCYLASGEYNHVYNNSSSTEVLKTQRYNNKNDSPERSVRVWDELNANFFPPAKISEYKRDGVSKTGWVSPFIRGKQAGDDQIREVLIDIFNSSGRIVIDAAVTGNFIYHNSGRIVCVDVGMAVSLHRDKETYESEEKKRKESVASLEAWESVFDEIGVFFENSKIEKPKTVNTLKALLFIKNNHPDVENVDFLKGDLDQTEKLAKAHDHQYANVIRTKRSCQLELKKYIDSRVLINRYGHFSSNFTTRIFRDVKITKAKAEYAKSLISAIDESVSIKEIQEAVDSILKDLGSSMKQEGFFLKSNLIKKIQCCEKIISAAIARDEKVVESNGLENKTVEKSSFSQK